MGHNSIAQRFWLIFIKIMICFSLYAHQNLFLNTKSSSITFITYHAKQQPYQTMEADRKVDIFSTASSSVTPLQQA